MPGEIAQVRTGIAVEVPPGYVGFVFARSGYSSRGIALANGVGVIDSGYRGELLVLLQNSSAQPHHIGAGSRIAQFIVMHVPFFEVLEVDELSDSERGEGGFGHSGD
jgi:dUTP pyrophosphatase